MQKLSLFILNKGRTLDESSKGLLKSVFNENSTRLIEHYEKKVEEQRVELARMARECIDAY